MKEAESTSLGTHEARQDSAGAANTGWDEEDQELLDSSMRDMAIEEI